jgi:hypothetical protein
MPRDVVFLSADPGQNRIGALLLLVATLAAIVWANVSLASYETFWETHLMVGIADLHVDFTLHTLVNDALMAIFFFTVGLEVRREFAIGELTSWSRAMVPVAAAIAGLVVPALLFVLIARGSGRPPAPPPPGHRWCPARWPRSPIRPAAGPAHQWRHAVCGRYLELKK